MQTPRETASSLSGQQAAVVMAAREQTGASGGTRNSPAPGGITFNNNYFLVQMNSCVGVQLGQDNVMNIPGTQSYQQRPPQGGNNDSSSDSSSDDDDDEDEDSRRRQREQKDLLRTLEKTVGSEDDKPATKDQLKNLSQKFGKQWRLFCRSVGVTDREMEHQLALQSGHQPADVIYKLLLLQEKKSGNGITVSQLARAIRKQGPNSRHLVELLQ